MQTDTEPKERRKKAGEFLRMADKFFKVGDYEEAERLSLKAIEVDPGNPYALAYRERIGYAREYAIRKNASAKPVESSKDGGGSAEPKPEVVPPVTDDNAIREAEAEVRRKLEEAQRSLEEERKRFEEEARRHSEEASRRAKEEEEEERRRTEELKKATEEIRVRILEEARVHLESERERLAQEAKSKLETERKRIEEELRIQAEEERRRRAEGQEQDAASAESLLRQKEEEMRRMEEDLRSRLDEEKQRLESLRREQEQEWQRLSEEKSRELEAAEHLVLEKEERLKEVEQDVQGRFEAEKARLEDEKKKLEEEMGMRLNAERLELEEMRKRLEKEAEARLEEEAQERQRIEAEKERLEAEKQRLEEEMQSKMEAEEKELQDLKQRHAEEERMRRDEEERERSRLKEEFQKRIEEEKERLAAERDKWYRAERARIEAQAREEAEREYERRLAEDREKDSGKRLEQQEEERRRQEELEIQRRREEEETVKYEEAVRQAIEDGRLLAQQKKIRSYIEKGREYLAQEQHNKALQEIGKVFLLDPNNPEARSVELTIYNAREEFLQKEDNTRSHEEAEESEEATSRLSGETRMELESERATMRAAKISGCLRRANECFLEGALSEALTELEAVHTLDPGNVDAVELTAKVLNAEKRRESAGKVTGRGEDEGGVPQGEQEGQSLQEGEPRSTYRKMLWRAWVDGKPNNEERSMLAVVRRSLGFSDDDHLVLEREVQLEAYRNALRSAMKAGIITANDSATHENFRELYGVRMDDHLTIEAALLREFQQEKLG